MKKFIADVINQVWTLLGMFVAWVVLTGFAKTLFGWLILATTAIWMVSWPLRRDADE